MNLKEWIIKKLEKDVEYSAGHVELENLSENERQQAFYIFSEGDANLKNFLEVSYNNGAPSIFCCSGHGKKPAYVTLKVTDENIELLRKVGKVLSNMDVIVNFTDDHIRGKYVSYHGNKIISTTWLETGANIITNPELYNDTNPSIYYHETFCTTYKPFGFDLKKKLLNYLRRKTISELECSKSTAKSIENGIRETYKISSNEVSKNKTTELRTWNHKTVTQKDDEFYK